MNIPCTSCVESLVQESTASVLDKCHEELSFLHRENPEQLQDLVNIADTVQAIKLFRWLKVFCRIPFCEQATASVLAL